MRKWTWRGCWATCLTVDLNQEVVTGKVTNDKRLTVFLVIDSYNDFISEEISAASAVAGGLPRRTSQTERRT
jgi:hypothetical protein